MIETIINDSLLFYFFFIDLTLFCRVWISSPTVIVMFAFLAP